jgi:hypothetical protein
MRWRQISMGNVGIPFGSYAGIRIGNVGDYPLRRHPELAALAAEAIASWTNVESFMLRLFVQLMGGPAETAATVFLALEIQSAKMAAINAVAPSLPEGQRHLLRALMAIAATNQRSRDRLAHWIWGDCIELPQALLLLNPKVAVLAETGDVDLDDVYVYVERDFREIIKANERLAGFGLQFMFILADHPVNQDGQLLRQLCAEPEIRERLRYPAWPARSAP